VSAFRSQGPSFRNSSDILAVQESQLNPITRNAPRARLSGAKPLPRNGMERIGTNANVQLDRGSCQCQCKVAGGSKGGAEPGDTCELSAAIKAATATWIKAAFTAPWTVGDIGRQVEKK